MTALEIILIILIILFVGGIVGRSVWRTVKNKKAAAGGKNSGVGCGCGCSGCAKSGTCPAAQSDRAAIDADEQMPDVTVLSEVTCDFDDIVKALGNNADNN